MKFTENFDLILTADGSIKCKTPTDRVVIPTDSVAYNPLKTFYNEVRYQNRYDFEERENQIQTILNMLADPNLATAPTPTPAVPPEKLLQEGIKDLIKFFTEFSFEPNFRFLNTLAHALQQNNKSAQNYISQYFELIDSPYINEVNAKMKSPEFSAITTKLSAVAPTKTVNERFKLYYGSQGTGKTTIAMRETNNKVMVCNSSMLPSDIMEDFVFVEGKATFQPSALWRAMVSGEKIVLDEINLLPFDTLRFLQTILDGKKEFLYKGNQITIADGFQIIGTMNLVVNGMTYGLPEPLVDRCAETRKFSLTPKDLVSAIM